ncbi:MAG: hypothetical protein AB1432_11580 [Bacteroidota bacterium]
MATKRLLILLLLCTSLAAQPVNYNLRELTTVKIEIFDDYNLLPTDVEQKILTETKLKLIAAGIKIDDKNPIAAFQISLHLNFSNAFVEPRILLGVALLEKVQTFRKGLPRTEAKTYSNFLLFQASRAEMSAAIYKHFFDKLLIEFLENWFRDNN